MSISSTTRQAGPYAGNDVTTVFPFAFKVFVASELLVTSTDPDEVQTVLTLDTDYSVSLNADQNVSPGGNVTLSSALATGYELLIESDVAALQPTQLTNAGGFYPKVINEALDRVTILVQQLQARFNTLVPSQGLPVSSYIATVLDDANGAAARATLGAAAIDLTNSTYLSSATGAVVRATRDKLNDWISVKDFGAVGDGVTNDAPAIQAAATYAAANNKQLYFPAGIYACLAAITATPAVGNRVSWVGAGYRNAVLYWPSAAVSRGAHITYTDYYRAPDVSGLGFWTGASNNGTGLWITGPDVLSTQTLGPSVENCEFIGADVASHGWNTNIHFEVCWYINLRRVSIKGQDGSTAFASKVGIKLTSCQVCWASDFSILHCEQGVLEVASGGISHGEGFSLQSFEIVGGLDGIVLAADGTAPGTNIGPGQINTLRYGVKLANQWQTFLTGLLLYKTQTATNTYVGIEATDCNALRIIGNEVRGDTTTSTGDTYGIILTGTTVTDECVVADNIFQNFGGAAKVGVLVGTGVGKCSIHDNIGDTTLTACVAVNGDAEKTNRFKDNYPMGVQVFAANAATPSVGNDLSGKWRTANASATTITDFLDSYSTQVITLFVNDANTTIQHNATLILKGGINYAAPNGEMMVFVRDNTIWREVSRRG